MSDIILSSAVRSNLTSLQQTADLIAQTQTRLSTGKKVNSALDNPLNYFTSQSLSNRANQLSNLLDSVGNGVQTLDAANNGITSITKLVQSAQAIAQQAQQSAATTAKTTGSVTGLTGSTAFTATSGKTISISDGTTTATYTLAATGNTVQGLLDAVNNTSSLKVKAELSSDGAIQLEGTGSNAITVATDSGTATDLTQFGLSAGTSAAGTTNATRTSLATQYNNLLTQIDQLAGDAGYNGINLLGGDSLKVTFNETGTSSLSITGVKDSSAGLGITQSTNSFQSDSDINAALGKLGAALTTLQSQSANFGSTLSVVQTRQDFTKATINTLQTGSDNLVLADTNAEGANLLALQTRQSLSTTSLSLAAQASQNVLKLFGG
jgi:flagellin